MTVRKKIWQIIWTLTSLFVTDFGYFLFLGCVIMTFESIGESLWKHSWTPVFHQLLANLILLVVYVISFKISEIGFVNKNWQKDLKNKK